MKTFSLKLLLLITVFVTTSTFSQIEFTEHLIDNTNFVDLHTADIDNDGDLDIAAVLDGSNSEDYRFIYINNGDGTFESPITLPHDPENTGVPTIKIVDVDNDGLKDVVVTTFSKLYWHRNNGNNGFFPQELIEDLTSGSKIIASLELGDLDGDGKTDILVQMSGDPEFLWFKHISGNTFDMNVVDTTFDSFNLTATDVDNDGDLDVLTPPNIISGTIFYWQENDGNGNFTRNGIDMPLINDLSDSQLMDVDGDGINDLVYVSWDLGYDDIYFHPGDGNGNFGTRETIVSDVLGLNTSRLECRDIDSDGDTDILTISDFGVYLFENLGGDNNFNDRQIISDVTSGGLGLEIGDFDGDNDLDVLKGSTTLTWYENTSTLSVDQNTPSEFVMYPNPTRDILNINSENPIKRVEVYNSLGQLVLQSSSNQIDLSNLRSGVYFCKVEDMYGSTNSKQVIKQ